MAQVNLYAAARAAAGTSTLSIPAATLGALLDRLSQESPALAELLPKCSYLLNGLSAKDRGQILVEGDNVDVLPQFAGG